MFDTSVRYLDCPSVEATLESVSGAIGRTPPQLEAALISYNDATRPASEDPWRYMPRVALALLGIDVADTRFDGTHWFHGTRALDPSSFERDGILPLPIIVDRIWNSLFSLVEDVIDRERWSRFRAYIEGDGGGQSASLYRHRTGSRLDDGPFGELVRDVLLCPAATSSHNYLSTPETVEDIALEFASAYGIDLAARFAEVAKPCLVKFRSPTFATRSLETALVYAHQSLTEGGISGRGACHAYDGRGKPVPPEDVIGVEIL